MKSAVENVGSKFNKALYFKAREKTIAVVEEVVSFVEVGMTELDGLDLIEASLKKYGCKKKWHPSKFRIGKNTTKAFRELSDTSVKLAENDLYFIDIGPVFDDHEGDYGRTFVVGNEEKYTSIKEASEQIFRKTVKMFKTQKLSGHELYNYAAEEALGMGYELNMKMDGHRLSDFPHALFFKGGLNDLESTPKEDLWVLEILIRHPAEGFGAFFEDII